MQSVQLAASEVWVTLIFGVIMYLFRNELKQKKVTKILMIVCIARLLSDAVFWAFDGVPGLFWGTLTRCSNYVTFVSNDLVSLVFSIFLWNLVKDDEEKPGIMLKAYWALEAVAIGALTLNLHFGWFYFFDSGNGYNRGEYYRLTRVGSHRGAAGRAVAAHSVSRKIQQKSEVFGLVVLHALLPSHGADAVKQIAHGLTSLTSTSRCWRQLERR